MGFWIHKREFKRSDEHFSYWGEEDKWFSVSSVYWRFFFFAQRFFNLFLSRISEGDLQRYRGMSGSSSLATSLASMPGPALEFRSKKKVVLQHLQVARLWGEERLSNTESNNFPVTLTYSGIAMPVGFSSGAWGGVITWRRQKAG